MSAARKKKSKHSKNKKSPKKVAKVSQGSLAGNLRQETAVRYILSGLVVIYLVYYLFQLYASLDTTFFWADENKHAYICSLVSKTRQLPTVLPNELYGDYRWSYPPLFHILGGAFKGIAGSGALKFFNLILLSAFLPAFYFLIRKYYGFNESLFACLLMTLAPVLAINTVRFVTEMLSMICIFLSFFFLLIALKKADKILAVICGIFTAMLMLSKQAGFVVFGFYSLLLIWFFWKNRRNFKILLWVLGVTVLTYSPYLIWTLYHKIEILGFVYVFLGITDKPEWSGSALKVFQRYDSGIVEFFNLYYKSHGLLLTVLLILPVFYFLRIRFKDEPQNIVFFMFFFLVLAMMAWHITNDRHTIILLPLSAFLIGYTVNKLIMNKLIIRVMMISLLLFAGYLTYHLPNYRQRYNAPDEFIELTQFIKKSAAPDARILSLSKFDVIMYTQNPVIWPHAKLRNIPIDIFEKQTADELYALFKKYGIKYIVLEIPRIADIKKFRGGRYPLYFARNCERLERGGQLAFETKTKFGRFFLLSVN